MPPLAHFGADGTEQVGVLITLIGRLAWPRSLPCPAPRDRVFLAYARFILEPDFDHFTGRNVCGVGLKRIGEVFLKAAITASSCPGCCGRALMWEKPRDASSFEMVRSQ